MSRSLPLLLIAACVALSGCEAKITVDLAAAKYGDADQVNLMIDGVDLLDEDGSNHELDSSIDNPVNVLDYTDGDTTTLIDGAKIAQGRYTGLRLRFADSGSALVTSDGAEYPIDVGSGLSYADMDAELGDKDSTERLVVLETRFSLYPSTSVSGHYTLTPVLRVVYTDRSGSIDGTVDEALVRSSACQQSRTLGTGVAVYAFSGANVTPQDYVQNQGSSPVASADVVVSSDSTTFSYSFPALTAGDYTLAVTCNADSENPTTNDGLTFLATASVVLGEGESETVTLAE
ncbi:DUF4382 domain-containing protein [Hydrocarboniphaga sp.]|uniref:DUF4382 domain-containing protein n=1 Tax=Hydrocarboniphaga sp. TaxID=2033016 RepID=UPI002633F7F9|nr:DUF4382 domain-containing protein [Hydrocarboniphaga sp.]